MWSSVTVFKADTDGAVLPHGGNLRRLAVFSFLAVTTLAEAVKPMYGGISFGGNALRR